MTYSYAEKKRIRKDFGVREQVLEVPNLLAIQLDSYQRFLTSKAEGWEEGEIGLEAAFRSVFPIEAIPAQLRWNTTAMNSASRRLMSKSVRFEA